MKLAREIDVYISYARSERDIAARVYEALEAKGYAVWSDVNLAPGDNWNDGINVAIDQAKVVVVLWSKKSLESEWVKFEALRGVHKGSIIQVVVERDVSPPSLFSTYQFIDGSQNLELAIDSVVNELERLTGKAAATGRAEKPRLQGNRGFAFLSYSEQDSDFRTKLVNFLKTEGFAYWEFGESDREYETPLFLELEKRIAESTLVLSILSEAWKKSVWCVKEYFFAKEAGKPVFLLKAKELGPTLAIAGEHFIEFHRDESKGFERLARELKRRGL